MAGVTSTGFVAKTVQDLVSDVEAAEVANIDPQIDTSPEEPLGQLNGIYMEKVAELWELGALCYNAMSRDNAEGPQLDNVNGLTGTPREAAKPSYTLQTCVFSAVGTFPSGALVANIVAQPSVQFANGDDLSVALVGGLYVCTDTDTGVVLASNASLPLTVPGIKFFCTIDGPTVANASTLTVITTPVTGWASTTNPTDATQGALIEGDTAYRLRGSQEIAAVGSGNPDAIRADLLNVPGVIQAFVIENTTNFSDVYGDPPHSFHCVIWDGAGLSAANNDIAQVIWDDKPTGIPPQGNTTGNAIDSNGNTQVMPFDRATQETLYLQFNITMMPGQVFNATVALAIKQAVVAATLAQTISVPGSTTPAPNPAYLGLGLEVVAQAMKSAVMLAGLDVLDVTGLTLGFTASPVGTVNLPVNVLSIAIADTSRILVNGI